jgi:hypothetical protein
VRCLPGCRYANKIKLTLANPIVQAFGFTRQHLYPLTNVPVWRTLLYMIQAGTHAPTAAYVTPSGGNCRLDRERVRVSPPHCALPLHCVCH